MAAAMNVPVLMPNTINAKRMEYHEKATCGALIVTQQLRLQSFAHINPICSKNCSQESAKGQLQWNQDIPIDVHCRAY